MNWTEVDKVEFSYKFLIVGDEHIDYVTADTLCPSVIWLVISLFGRY